MGSADSDETKRAVGLKLRTNPRYITDAAGEPLHVVKARKLVVASSGACGTPSLLEWSGLGDSKVLERSGIPVIVDLPGVGNGYEDHHLTQGKVRPTEEEVAQLGPKFEKAWDKEFKDYREKLVVAFRVIAGFPGDLSLVTGDPCIAVTAFTVYSFSRGHIYITGPNIDDLVDFVTGLFTDEHQLDIKKHLCMYKKQREVIRRMPMYRGEMAHSHPPFDSNSDAACVALDGPLPTDAPPIRYTAEDDKVLERYLRENFSTTWHSLGTCKMLPREQQGVVDANLGVYGVRGLKIADLSVVPKNVAANTNHEGLAVGEKAADIFVKELELVS